MSEIGVFAFCAAIGFVSAGTIGSFYQLVTSRRPDFSVARGSLVSVGIGLLLSVFGGPFIVAQKVVAGLRAQELRALPAVVGMVIAGMWSVCAGVFYISLVLSG